MTGAGQGADNALKPCPFCGSPAAIYAASNAEGWWIIRCTDQADDAAMACRACPEVQEDNREMAVVHWNHREDADYSALLREVEGLKKALDEYGWHHHKCAAVDEKLADVRHPEIACTCGFDTAIDAALSPASGGV